MNTDYADAVSRFEDDIGAACIRAEDVLSNKEIADELRRIANEIEADNGCS